MVVGRAIKRILLDHTVPAFTQDRYNGAEDGGVVETAKGTLAAIGRKGYVWRLLPLKNETSVTLVNSRFCI
jgi:hypothetical protein